MLDAFMAVMFLSLSSSLIVVPFLCASRLAFRCTCGSQNACAIGGVNCLRLIHEHTATALAYGIYKSAKGEFSEKVGFSTVRHPCYGEGGRGIVCAFLVMDVVALFAVMVGRVRRFLRAVRPTVAVPNATSAVHASSERKVYVQGDCG